MLNYLIISRIHGGSDIGLILNAHLVLVIKQLFIQNQAHYGAYTSRVEEVRNSAAKRDLPDHEIQRFVRTLFR